MGNADEAAEQKAAKRSAKEAGATKLPLVPLIVAMMLAVILTMSGMGGMLFWLMKSGRLPVSGAVTKVEAAAKVEVSPSKLVVLEPLLVNLADDGGRAYLRVGMALRVEDPPPAKGEKKKEEAAKGKPTNENEAAMRDAALGVLGRETGEALLAPEGKDHLKEELRSAMKVHLPEVKVVDVLFTEFLVQR